MEVATYPDELGKLVDADCGGIQMHQLVQNQSPYFGR